MFQHYALSSYPLARALLTCIVEMGHAAGLASCTSSPVRSYDVLCNVMGGSEEFFAHEVHTLVERHMQDIVFYPEFWIQGWRSLGGIAESCMRQPPTRRSWTGRRTPESQSGHAAPPSGTPLLRTGLDAPVPEYGFEYRID